MRTQRDGLPISRRVVRYVTICLSIVILTIAVLIGVVYYAPSLMVEEGQLLSLALMPFLALIIGFLISLIVVIMRKVKWFVMLFTVPASMIAAFIGVVVVIRSPNMSNAIYTLFESRQFDIVSTNNAFEEVAQIDSNLPLEFANIVAIDGSDAKNGVYWYVAATNPHVRHVGDTTYVIGVFNSNSLNMSFVSVDSLWHRIQLKKKLPKNLMYTNISGIPTLQNKTQSALEDFTRNRTVYFTAADHKSYAIRLSLSGHSLSTIVSCNCLGTLVTSNGRDTSKRGTDGLWTWIWRNSSTA